MNKAKFRAWNPEVGGMIANVAVRNDVFIYAVQATGNDAWDVKYIECPEFRIMQYTGLKDKNDTEIYDGDILKVINHALPADVFIETVNFKKCEWHLGNLPLFNFFDVGDSVEVIGNIHENKHSESEL